MSQYPEHDRLTALEGKNRVVGDFLTWLGEQGFRVCMQSERDGHFWPVKESTEGWIAMFCGINMTRFYAEKNAMLETIRAAHDEVIAKKLTEL